MKMIMGAGGGGTKASTQAKRMAGLLIEKNKNKYGKITNPAVYDAANKILQPFSDDLTVAKDIAQNQNRKIELKTDQQEAKHNVTSFSADLGQERKKIVSENYNKPMAMINKLTNFYQKKELEFRKEIYAPAYKRKQREGREIEKEIRDYQETLAGKTGTLTQLSNSYNRVHPTTKVRGPVDADTYGVFLNTNTANGNIQDIEFRRTRAEDDMPDGFMVTNKRWERVPIYLPYVNQPAQDAQVAYLGDEVFAAQGAERVLREDTEGLANIMRENKWLRGAKQSVTGSKAGRIVTALGGGAESLLKGKPASTIDELQQNYPVEDLQMDSGDIPTDNLVKDGLGNMYYYGNDETLWKIQDEQALQNVKQEMRNNSSVSYEADLDFMQEHYQPDEAGNFPTLSKEDYGRGKPAKLGSPMNVAKDIKSEDITLGRSLRSGLRNFRSGSQRILPEAREYVQNKGYKPSRIIEKGKDIFRR